LNIKLLGVIKTSVLLLTCYFGATGLLTGQTKSPPRPEGYWLSYFGDNKINSRIGIHSELQLRSFLMPHAMQTLLARAGLNYYIRPYAMATAGYGYIYSVPSGDEVAGSQLSEHRIWQQLLLRQKHTHIFMDHRYRLEQRFINNLTTHTSQLDHRLRYRFQALFPLYSIDPHLRHWFLAFNNEIMINLKKEPSRLFDRNRLFAGIGYQVSPRMNFQLGYLNQYAQVPGNSRPHIDHVLLLAVSYNMDDLMQSLYRKKPE